MTFPFDFRFERAAFIVVDLQNDFVRQDAPLGVPDALATIEPVNRVIGAFRGAGRPVCFTRFVGGPEESILWTWSPEMREPVNCCQIGYRRTYPDVEGERDVIEIVDELDRQAEDIIVDKYWYGAFFRTNLEDRLYSHGVDAVVIAGTVTQICVEETARQAFHHGFKVIVLSDCVSSFDTELHNATLKNLGMKFGAVMTSAQFLESAFLAGAKA